MIVRKKKEKIDFLKENDPLEYCKKHFKLGTVFNNSEILNSDRASQEIFGDNLVFEKSANGNILACFGYSNDARMRWTVYNEAIKVYAKIIKDVNKEKEEEKF